MKIEIPGNAEVQRLRLEPGDKLVVRVPGRIDRASAAALQEVTRAALGLREDVPVLVLSEGADLEVVSSS